MRFNDVKNSRKNSVNLKDIQITIIKMNRMKKIEKKLCKKKK